MLFISLYRLEVYTIFSLKVVESSKGLLVSFVLPEFDVRNHLHERYSLLVLFWQCPWSLSNKRGDVGVCHCQRCRPSCFPSDAHFSKSSYWMFLKLGTMMEDIMVPKSTGRFTNFCENEFFKLKISKLWKPSHSS